jgi:antirestriction protein ArdC
MSIVVYKMVQERILEKLEEAIKNGTAPPWRKPWIGGLPKNYISKKPYRGINLMLLDGGSYITFKQIQSLQKNNKDIKLKKGSKSLPVVFWKFVEKEDDDSYPVIRYYRVFSIKDVEGLKEDEEQVRNDHDPIELAEMFLANHKKEVKHKIQDGSNRAYYNIVDDSITMPHLSQFVSPEEYYSTFFHEIIHSTGHQKRLGRFKMDESSSFGSESYSKEELVAEIGCNFLLAIHQIEDTRQQENSIAYLESWSRKIRKEPGFIVSAAQAAQKAYDYLEPFLDESLRDEDETKENKLA